MVTVGRILEGAFDLIRERFGAVVIWAAVYLVMSVVMLVTLQPLFSGLAAGADGVPVGPGRSMADRADVIGMMLPIYGMNLVMMLVGVVLYAAAMRAVLRPEASSFGYLRLGGDELRLLLLLLLFSVGGFVVMILWGMIVGIVIVAVGASGATNATIWLAVASGLASFSLALYLIIRFSLAFPLTLHRKHLVIGEAWRQSKGRFWTLFGSSLVVTLLGSVLMAVVSVFSAGSYFADLMAASGDYQAIDKAAQAQMLRAGTVSPAMILQSLAGAAIGAIWIALSGGSAATAAKLIVAPQNDDAETVFG